MSTSTLSKIERDGIRKALEAVREQGLSYKNRGLSPTAYFIGMLNVGVTPLIVGRYPEYYWLIHLFKGFFYLGAIYYIRYKKKELLYLLDFCWVICHVYIIYAFIAFIGVIIDDPDAKTFVSD